MSKKKRKQKARIRKADVIVPVAFALLALTSYVWLDGIGPFSWGSGMDWAMRIVTEIGEYYTIFIAGSLLFLYAVFMRKAILKKQSLFFLIVFALDTAMIIALKGAFGRERPDASFPLHSFPSGHAARGAFMARIIGAWYPKLRWWLWAFAIIIAFSRIYLGAHYLSDICAGFAISYATAAVYVCVYRRYFIRKKWLK